MENKIANVPVASHGLHKHNYNYPWLSSINFGDVMPCYINTLRKGERDFPTAGMYSQLMPILHNAFATGRFNFKSIFVPYKLVWRPWYSFDQQTDYVSDGVSSKPTLYPYVSSKQFTLAFIAQYCQQITTTAPYDIVLDGGQGSVTHYVVKNDAGRRVLRILGALGCTPSFVADKDDNNTMNILAILCYIKAYSDYYYPNNYVGNNAWLKLSKFFDRDTIDFSSECIELLAALEVASLNFYENSIFDIAWDNPVTPNTSSNNPQVVIYDRTDPDQDVNAVVENQTSGVGTPAVTNAAGDSLSGFTQFLVDALKSLSMWMKRNQLTGARLIDRFLVSRGISLGNDSARISYYIGERNIEIECNAVENNSDSNLGELAGRGLASTGDKPLSFNCKPDDDGILFVIVSPIPDSSFPVNIDGFTCRKDYMDNYKAEFDKLSTCPVPARVIRQSLDGSYNNLYKNSVFGFLNQYWDEIQERPRLLGDFLLSTRGATQLRAYHTFRVLSSSVAAAHSYDFVRMEDASQYQRLFYSSEQDNIMLFLRWRGKQYKEKLPLGDSYEWDDDELNKRVSVVVGGSQK